MPEYNSNIKKLEKTWNRVLNTRDSIFRAIEKQTKLFNQLNVLNVPSQVLKVSNNISFDWTTPEPVLEDINGEAVGSVVQWKVGFDNITEHIKNSIRPVIIYRFGNAGVETNSSLKVSTSISQNICFSIEPGTELGNLKNYLLDVAVSLTDNSGIQGDIQFKLLLYILNTNTYI